MLPTLTPRRLEALAFAALVIAIFVLAVLPFPSLILRIGFTVQGLGSACFIMRQLVGNRRAAE